MRLVASTVNIHTYGQTREKADAVEAWKKLLALIGDKICDFTKTQRSLFVLQI